LTRLFHITSSKRKCFLCLALYKLTLIYKIIDSIFHVVLLKKNRPNTLNSSITKLIEFEKLEDETVNYK